MEIATAVSLAVAIMSAMIALATYIRNGKHEQHEGENEAIEHEVQIVERETAIITKLDFMGNDLKDIKADNRRTREEMASIRNLARHAEERAEAAHRRLDRAGIDSAFHTVDHTLDSGKG